MCSHILAGLESYHPALFWINMVFGKVMTCSNLFHFAASDSWALMPLATAEINHWSSLTEIALKQAAHDSQLNVVISKYLESVSLLHLNKRLQTQIALFGKIYMKKFFPKTSLLSAFAYVVSIWCSFNLSGVKTFPISLPVLLIKMPFTFLGKIWYSKMSFHCESECTFPWNKNSGKGKKCYWKCWTNYIVISTRLYKKKRNNFKVRMKGSGVFVIFWEN